MSTNSLWKFFFGRRERKAHDSVRESIRTWANAVTLLRATGSAVILVVAIIEQSHELLIGGMALSMAFDFCDGMLARWRKVETVLGAQLDGMADRIAAALIAAGTVSMHPDAEIVVAATVVWIQFGVLDQLLTSQFLRFGLWSPDHFYMLDEEEAPSTAVRVWQLNWSMPAKLASNLPIFFLAIGAPWVALALALALIVVRVPCYRSIRLLAEKLPESHGKIPAGREPSPPARQSLSKRRRGSPSGKALRWMSR